MKIGIVGLKPRQMADLRNREFAHELSFFDSEKHYSAAALASFSRDMDTVLFLQQVVPKHIIKASPADKRVMLTGSISSVIQYVEGLDGPLQSEVTRDQEEPDKGRVTVKRGKSKAAAPAPVVKEEQAPVKRPLSSIRRHAAPTTMGDLLVNALAGQVKLERLTSLVPDGRTSEYVRPERNMPLLRGKDVYDLNRPMQRASVGEVVRFEADKDITFSERLAELRSMLAFLEQRWNFTLEAHLYEDYTDVLKMTRYESYLPRKEEAPQPIEFIEKEDEAVEQEPVTEEAPVPSAPLTIKASSFDLPADKVAVEQPLASDVPEGLRSQYLLPKFDSDIVIRLPNSGGVHDYTILHAAEPGDIIRFARPEGLELGKWRYRITSMRRDKWVNKGILMEAHFFAEYVDIKVMDKNPSVIPGNTLNLCERAEPVEDPRPMGSTTVVTGQAEGLPTGKGPEFDFDEDDLRREFDAVMSAPNEYKAAPAEMLTTNEAPDQRIDAASLPSVVRDSLLLEEGDTLDLSKFGNVEGLRVFAGLAHNPDAEVEALGEAANIVVQPPVVPESPKFLDATKGEKKFWRIIFLAEFDITGEVDVAVAKADAAMVMHKARFG